MTVAENIKRYTSILPDNVKLVAVSKTKPNELIVEAYEAGQRIFGENKVQDLCKKQEELPADIQWHFIGHLQRNKVKYLAPFIDTIHSVDSLKLLKEINKHALANNRQIKCLLQFHIAEEESKFGLNIKEAEEILNSEEYSKMHNIKICGVMGMATFTENKDQIRNEFKSLKSYFDRIKAKYFIDKEYFKEISMGMTNDYEIAISEGSTMIRIGTDIFGMRNY